MDKMNFVGDPLQPPLCFVIEIALVFVGALIQLKIKKCREKFVENYAWKFAIFAKFEIFVIYVVCYILNYNIIHYNLVSFVKIWNVCTRIT